MKKYKNLNNFIFGYHTVLSTIKYMPKRSIKLYLKKSLSKKNKIITEANKKKY